MSHGKDLYRKRLLMQKEDIMKRVVVTGLGAVTPSGITVSELWNNVSKGNSSITTINRFDTTDMVTTYAGVIPDTWDDTRVTPKKQHRIYDRFMLLAFDAVDQAIIDSNLESDPTRTGINFGSGVGGLETYYDASTFLKEKGARRFSPFWLPSALINLTAGHLAIKYGFRGPSIAPATACATSANAIGEAYRYIKYGIADVMIAGGSEAAVNRLGIAGFGSMRALSTGFTDNPTQASRPWDKDRDGFVMSEGAGAVVLEEYEHALARGARIYGEVVGYGQSTDAYHFTSPDENGIGGATAMRIALAEAGLSADDINYINAHGTSTPLGDDAEIKGILSVFGENVTVSSTKSSTGHMLGAAGAVESILTLKTMENNYAPPTINLDNPSIECSIDRVAHVAKHMNIECALSNSFAFGGINASLIFKKI